MAADKLNAVLVDRQMINPDLARFRVQYKDREVPAFQPGQYVNLGVPGPMVDGKPGKLVRRMYSIASPATERDALEFYIVKVDGGALTPSLFDLNVGDGLFVAERITGHFTMEHTPPGRDLVMVGTGTGLAPFRSMLLTYRGQARWRKFVLLEGCRLRRDLGYFEELSALAEQGEDFQYLPTLTRESGPWGGLAGRVTDLLQPEKLGELTGVELKPESASVFLCGNPAMITQVEQELMALGYGVYSHKNPTGTLHFEKYW